MGDGELVEHARQAGVDHGFDAGGPQIERGQGRENDAAHFRDGGHIAQMGEVERRLARQQHQFAALFQAHVCRASDEIVAKAVGNGRQRAHGAGRHHHAQGGKRAAGNGRADVADGMHHFRQRLDCLAVEVHFHLEVEHAGGGNQQMRLNAADPLQMLQQSHAIDDARRPGQRHDESWPSHGSGGLKGGVKRMSVKRMRAYFRLPSRACSSPLCAISAMMSEPPTNSPLT